MRSRRPLTALLALALLGVPATGSVRAEEPELRRAVQDAVGLSVGSQAWLVGSRELTTELEDAMEESAARAARDAAIRQWAESELRIVKAELSALHGLERMARSQLSGPEHECERRFVEQSVQAAMAALRTDVTALRTLRGGDKSKLFSRIGRRISRGARQAWRWIGPVPRRILGLAGEEALTIVMSGGTLGGGTARKLLVRATRQQVPELVLAAVTRKARRQEAEIMAAAREACGEEAGAKPTPMPSRSVPLGEGGCPPRPPYGVPAYVIELTWDQPVRVSYGVATKVDPLDGSKPQLHLYLHGDVAVTSAGCSDLVRPLLITRRDQSRGSVDLGVQAEPGVGTYSACGTGSDWAGQEMRNEVPGQPWTYTIVVEGVGPCEGAYQDLPPEYPDMPMWRREMPESTTVTATVTYYPAMSAVPSGEPLTLSADVGVLDAIALENAEYHAVEYQRPPPVALGQVTLPAIAADPPG